MQLNTACTVQPKTSKFLIAIQTMCMFSPTISGPANQTAYFVTNSWMPLYVDKLRSYYTLRFVHLYGVTAIFCTIGITKR
jgi:hypothetical protein